MKECSLTQKHDAGRLRCSASVDEYGDDERISCLAANDAIADDGNVYDTDRVVFLRAFLTQL